MRFAAFLCLGLIVFLVLVCPLRSQDVDRSLRLYAVHIDRTPKQSWTGYGVYLGSGIVITAAHVVGGGDVTKPQVEIDGKHLSTTVVKDGDLDTVDLTLLAVDERQLPDRLGRAHMELCQKRPAVGEPVFVATPEGTARSHVMSPSLLPSNISAKFQTVIRYVDVAGTGNSGAGVFDAEKKCLLGILSRKISDIRTRQINGRLIRESYDIAKYFVPALEIAQFIPANVR